MAYEMKDGQWNLFANTNRTKDTQPTHTGKLMLNGKEYKLSAWVKEGKSGRFFSGKAELPSLRETSRADIRPLDDDGEIPF